MNKIRECIRKVFWLYVVMFACLIVSIIAILLNANQLSSPYNPRIKKEDPLIMQGDLRDYNNKLLVQTIKENNSYNRDYIYNQQFAHILGYSDKGRTGISARYKLELSTLRFETFQRLKKVIRGTDLRGNNLILTLNQEIQKNVYDLLGTKKGAIIVTEPSTGKILAMVSYPNFNPNTISIDWDKLNNDKENSPMLNRATQGVYTPGSVFKIVTAAAFIENIDNWQDFTYECLGEATFGDKKIHCYNSTKHGVVNLKQAFAHSCNTAFAELGTILGADVLRKTAERLGFNNSIDYPMDYKQSTFLLTENSSKSELVQTAIGQGKTSTTPLEMIRIVSAIANAGMLMKPYVVDHIEDNSNNTIKKYFPKKELQLFSNEVSNELVNMMIEVVEIGTATSAKINNLKIAGKTGTAEVDNKNPHSWFVGFAPAQNPQIAIVVLLENHGNNNQNATTLAKKVIENILQ